jgi:hypothetical protein
LLRLGWLAQAASSDKAMAGTTTRKLRDMEDPSVRAACAATGSQRTKGPIG